MSGAPEFAIESQLAAATTASASATASLKPSAVFAAWLVAGIACMALSVTRFVALEVSEGLRAAGRHRAVVAIMRIIAVVDMAIEAVRAMEPGTGSEEQPADEPIRAIVPIRSAVVRGIVEVPIRAHRRWPNVDADADLGRRHGSSTQQGSSNGGKSERFESLH
jgi:hypothetical protein